LRFGHFRIEFGGFLIFRAGFVGAFQRGKRIGQLKAHKGDVRFSAINFCNGMSAASKSFCRGRLGFVEEIVERIAELLCFSLRGFVGRVLDCSENKVVAECGQPHDSGKGFRPRRMPRHTTRTCDDGPSWLYGRQLRRLVFHRRNSR